MTTSSISILTWIIVFGTGAVSAHPRSTARRLTPVEISQEEVRDTIGLGAFLDSLQADVDRGRLTFFLGHMENGFNGHTLFCCGNKEDQVLRSDSAYAHSTAQVLAWHLSKHRIQVSDNGVNGFAVFAARVSTTAWYPLFSGKKPKNPNSYSVNVGDSAQPLLDTISGKALGTVGSLWVKPLKQVGGFKPYKYTGTIHVEWMKIQTPDGRIGWIPAKELRDSKGPGADIELQHQRRGWRITGLTRWDDVQDEDP